jgi:two-component system sensor histidine kinase BaeS
LRFTGPDGSVRLSCRRDGSSIVVEVADDGEGIAADRLPTVFERQWHPGMADERSGTGLGLAIVRAIAEGHGGTAAIDSALGRGTCVSLRLPVAAAPVPLVDDTSSRATERRS